MTTTLDRLDDAPAATGRGRWLAPLAVALLLAATVAGVWSIRPDPMCADVPGARTPVSLVGASERTGDITVDGQNFVIEYVAMSDHGQLTPLFQLLAGSFAAPLSLPAAAADGQPHQVAVDVVEQPGGMVLLSVVRDGTPSASVQLPGQIPETVQVRIRSHNAGTVVLGLVSCHLG